MLTDYQKAILLSIRETIIEIREIEEIFSLLVAIFLRSAKERNLVKENIPLFIFSLASLAERVKAARRKLSLLFEELEHTIH